MSSCFISKPLPPLELDCNKDCPVIISVDFGIRTLAIAVMRVLQRPDKNNPLLGKNLTDGEDGSCLWGVTELLHWVQADVLKEAGPPFSEIDDAAHKIKEVDLGKCLIGSLFNHIKNITDRYDNIHAVVLEQQPNSSNPMFKHMKKWEIASHHVMAFFYTYFLTEHKEKGRKMPEFVDLYSPKQKLNIERRGTTMDISPELPEAKRLMEREVREQERLRLKRDNNEPNLSMKDSAVRSRQYAQNKRHSREQLPFILAEDKINQWWIEPFLKQLPSKTDVADATLQGLAFVMTHMTIKKEKKAAAAVKTKTAKKRNLTPGEKEDNSTNKKQKRNSSSPVETTS